MSFPGLDYPNIPAHLGDPAGGTVAFFKFRRAGELIGVDAVDSAGLAAGSPSYGLFLQNGGTAGTGTTVISNTIRGTLGWDAGQKYAFTLSTTKFAAGSILKAVQSDENGATTPNLTLFVDAITGGYQT